MDPEVLMMMVMLDYLPQLQGTWIEGFEMMMRSPCGTIYTPALLPNDGAQSHIKGKAWQATTMTQWLRIQRYRTSAYEAADCHIHFGSDEPVKGLVFQLA
jgi:hypothetical protein